MKKILSFISIVFMVGLFLYVNADDELLKELESYLPQESVETTEGDQELIDIEYDINKHPDNYVLLNDGKMKLDKSDKHRLDKRGTETAWVNYKGLDQLGRGQDVQALLTCELVFKQSSKVTERPDFSSSVGVAGQYKDGRLDRVKETWRGEESNNTELHLPNHNGYLYNKSHTLAWSLGGSMETENVTLGTRRQNVGSNDADGGGMGYPETTIRNQFYNEIGLNDMTKAEAQSMTPEQACEKSNTKVYYDVDPVYQDDELVPRGTHVRAYSINDDGETINMNLWVFNTQPYVDINYADGTFTVNQ